MKPIQRKNALPRIGPANNAHHWKDWQKRHGAPRAIDLLRKMHEANQQLKQEAEDKNAFWSSLKREVKNVPSDDTSNDSDEL